MLSGCGDGTGPPEPPGPAPLPALEPTPHAQLGGVRIAFQRLGGDASGVYWLDGGSGNSAGGFREATDPALSGDGRRLAFRALTSFATAWDVYVADLDGGGRQQLSSAPGNVESAPAWTPVNAVVWGVFEGPVLFVRHATAGAQPEPIGSITQPPSQLCPYYTPLDGPPSLSPSGEILFVCQRMAVYRMVPNGQPVLVHTQPGADAGAIRHAVWSPAGDRFALLYHHNAEHSSDPGFVRVFVLDEAGGTPTLIAERPIPAGAGEFGNAPRLTLCWAGDRIIFAAPTGHFTAHLFVVPLAGGTPVQVTSAPGVSDGSVSCSRTAF